MTEVHLLIGDRDAAASNAATFVRKNPISGEVATRAADAGADDAILAAEPPPKPSLPGPRSARTSAARNSCAPPTCSKRAHPTSSP